MIDDDNDPKNWKLGVFYFNPQDKRIFVPKRVAAMGFTINFAHPLAAFVVATILAFIIVLAVKR